MDNQIINQEPINQEPINQEPIIETPVIPETPTVEPTLRDFGIAPKPPQNNIFKIIFIFSLIIFILTASAFAFVYYQSQKKSSSTNNSTSTISSAPTSSGTCFLNDKTYQIGESFASADGCNTCSCQSQDTIVCTEKACLSTPFATSSSTLKDWKTYTNSTYKYSIQYPNTYQVKETAKNLISVGTPEMFKLIEESPNLGTNLKVTIYSSLSEASNNSPKIKTLKDLAINMTDPPEQNYKEITIGGVSGFTVTTDYPDTRIYLQKGNQIYYIFDGSLDNNSVEKQIIKTIKFN